MKPSFRVTARMPSPSARRVAAGLWVALAAWVSPGTGCGDSPSFQNESAGDGGVASNGTGADPTLGPGVGPGSGFGGGDASSGSKGDPTTCAEAANARTNVGCDFWPTTNYNPVYSIFDFAAVVANAGANPAEVTVERNGVSVGAKVTVPPGGLERVFLPWVKELKGDDFDGCTSNGRPTTSVFVKHGAYHLKSTAPVTVWQFNPLEYKAHGGPPNKSWVPPFPPSLCNGNGRDTLSVSNDASLLLPTTALTGNYRLFGKTGARGAGGAASRESPGAYTLTATADGTTVDVYVAKDSRGASAGASSGIAAGPGVPATPAGQKVSFAMDAGDVVELLGVEGQFFDGRDFDMSGSVVKANKPIQVVSLIPIVDIPTPETAGNGYADHCEETVLPAEVLGGHYVVAPPTTPNLTSVGHYVRFYGNEDGTRLSYPAGMPSGAPLTLDASQVVEIGPVNTAFEVNADKSFAIGSFMLGGMVQDPLAGAEGARGDPSFSMEVTVEQFRDAYAFLAPDDYDVSVADILVPTGAVVKLDGAELTGARTPIGSNWAVVRQPLGTGVNGAHKLEASKPVGVQVMGFGHATSYYTPGGLNLKLIAPPPGIPR